jgi:hypothetical protein
VVVVVAGEGRERGSVIRAKNGWLVIVMHGNNNECGKNQDKKRQRMLLGEQ